MGLDQNLEGEKYIGGQYKHNNVKGVIYSGEEPIYAKDLCSVTYALGDWRKANSIHKWFVDNIQDGEDDCGRYLVQRELLHELKAICVEILNAENVEDLVLEKLPPQAGFFFGSTDIDEEYMNKIEHTVEIIDKALEFDGDIYYSSSW